MAFGVLKGEFGIQKNSINPPPDRPATTYLLTLPMDGPHAGTAEGPGMFPAGKVGQVDPAGPVTWSSFCSHISWISCRVLDAVLETRPEAQGVGKRSGQKSWARPQAGEAFPRGTA